MVNVVWSLNGAALFYMVCAITFATYWIAYMYLFERNNRYIQQTGQLQKFYDWNETRKQTIKKVII